MSDRPGFELVIRPHRATSLRDLADVWRYRELLWTLALRDVRVRYKQAAFGVLWAVVQPLAQMVVFTILFHRVAGIRSTGALPYPVFAYAGLVLWTLFAGGLSAASNSLIENARVITKVYFPRIVIPLASILVALVDFAIAFAILLVMLPLYGVPIQPTLILAPALAALAGLAAFALGLWTSAINIQFRDVRYALPFFLQLLIFVSPVFYPISMVPEPYRTALLLNPMAAYIEAMRAAVAGDAIAWGPIAIATGLVLAIAASGFLYFMRMERTFADRA